MSNAGWTLSEVELFELNEAFAAQSVAIVKELGCCFSITFFADLHLLRNEQHCPSLVSSSN